MTSIAQGKRSDTLGKPPHHITPRPARAKVNITRSVSALLPLQGASYTAHYTQGVASLALGYGGHWAFSPHGICVDLWHLWENKSSSLFLSALCAYLSPTDLSDLHRCSFTPHAKKSAIRCTGGASKTKQQAVEQE